MVCDNYGNSFRLPVPKEIDNPQKYNLPKEIEIRVCNKLGMPIKKENIIITIERGYTAGPFFTNKQGVVKISKSILEDEEKDWISSGGGDNRSFNLIRNLTVTIPSREFIDKWIESRQSTWSFLLEHEKRHWKSFADLINAMKNSTNYKVESASSSIGLSNFTGNENIICTIKTKYTVSKRQKMLLIVSSVVGTIVGISMVNQKIFSIQELLSRFFK